MVDQIPVIKTDPSRTRWNDASRLRLEMARANTFVARPALS